MVATRAIRLSAAVLALVLLSAGDCEGRSIGEPAAPASAAAEAKKEPATAPPRAVSTDPAADPGTPYTLRIRVGAEPLTNVGELVLEIEGEARTANKNDVVLQEGSAPLPMLDHVRNPTIINYRFLPTIILRVTVRVTAGPGQRSVWCEIIDRGKLVSYKIAEKDELYSGVVQCGPYDTARGLLGGAT